MEPCKDEDETDPDVNPDVESDPGPDTIPDIPDIWPPPPDFKEGAMESRDVALERAADFRMNCTS